MIASAFFAWSLDTLDVALLVFMTMIHRKKKKLKMPKFLVSQF